MLRIVNFSLVLTAALIAFSQASFAAPADCTNCGDADGNGMYTVADIAYITAFLYAGGPAPAECADIDGYDLITIRDVVVGGTMASPQCVTLPKIVAQPTPTYRIVYLEIVPANVSTYSVEVHFWNNSASTTANINGFDLPLLVRVDGQVPLSLSASAAGSNWPGGGLQISIDSVLGAVLVGSLSGSVGAGYYDLFEFTIGVAPSPSGHIITLEYTDLAPTMTGVFAPPNSACHYALFLDANLNAWQPALVTDCLCGDADNSGFYSISDAVYIINYIFAGGPEPEFFCIGDADGNAIITISDAVYLIGYIFAGGPAPSGC